MRHRSATCIPASASFKTPIICSHMDRDFFMTRLLPQPCRKLCRGILLWGKVKDRRRHAPGDGARPEEDRPTVCVEHGRLQPGAHALAGTNPCAVAVPAATRAETDAKSPKRPVKWRRSAVRTFQQWPRVCGLKIRRFNGRTTRSACCALFPTRTMVLTLICRERLILPASSLNCLSLRLLGQALVPCAYPATR